jgi:aminoglycoside/choline kinase family phosphotransferase
VVAEAIDTRTGEKTLLLRQFIAPNLLITNSEGQNSISIHMLKAMVTIMGIVLR